jgi:hypothetical protein
VTVFDSLLDVILDLLLDHSDGAAKPNTSEFLSAAFQMMHRIL